MAISDARRGRSPVPITQFRDSATAREYAQAYAKQVGSMSRSKKKKFFGDPDFYLNQGREWEEVLNNQSDPLTRPGLQRPTNGWWGSNWGSNSPPRF